MTRTGSSQTRTINRWDQTSKLGALETVDDVKRRIDEAGRFAPLYELALLSQCGFSSTVHGNAISFGQRRAKPELVQAVLRDVWGNT